MCKVVETTIDTKVSSLRLLIFFASSAVLMMFKTIKYFTSFPYCQAQLVCNTTFYNFI